MVKVELELSEGLWEVVATRARKDGVSPQVLTQRALEDYLTYTDTTQDPQLVSVTLTLTHREWKWVETAARRHNVGPRHHTAGVFIRAVQALIAEEFYLARGPF